MAFCVNCGTKTEEGVKFCSECGKTVNGAVDDSVTSSSRANLGSTGSINVNMLRHIIKGCSILLCVFFFILPLVKCSEDSSKAATGWEIATGSGDIFKYSDKSYPLVFALIVVPVILTVAAFANKSFEALSKISFVGLLVKIIALIWGNSILKSEYEGAFALTGINWLIVFIYIGLCAITFYCLKVNTDDNFDQRRTINKKCRQCGNLYTEANISCPKCGSSFYEETSEKPINSYTPSGVSVGDTWVCKKCSERNSINSTSCKGCGAYK